jgi:hypothetical protein
LPGNIVSIGQQAQVRAQCGPISLHARIERVPNHESIDSRRAVEHRFNIRGSRFVLIETVFQALCFFLERFDIGVDIVFTLGAINTALVKRLLEAVAKRAGFAFDPIQQPRNFAIADAIWLAGHLGAGT